MTVKKDKTSAPKTFQYRLIFYNVTIVICIALTVSLYNFHAYRKDAIDSAAVNSSNQLTTLSARLNTAYDEMVNILVNCTERDTTLFPYYNASSADNHGTPYQLWAADALANLCAVSGYNNYIYKLTIYQKDFLTLQAGSAYGFSDDVKNIMTAPWFHEYLVQTTSQYSLKLADNPFTFGTASHPKLLPMLRPIKTIGHTLPEDAWVFLAISPKLYEDSLKQSSSNHIYAVTRDGDIIAQKDDDALPVSDLITQLLNHPDISGGFLKEINDESCIISFHRQLYSGLLLFEVLPISELNIDLHVIFNTILALFFFCTAVGFSLSLLFAKQLTAPIGRLIDKLDSIATGNFDYDASIETNDEIGVIGRQINRMSGHIAELLESRVHVEKEKKDLEIKMLQAQINPHFLYNTLDSVKWIATMQKNTGIVQIITALSSLLKNMAKGFNEKVTFRQELDFLDNYVTIEKIRYIELFDVEISVDDPSLYAAKIVKLTLQPIVENAIFSGIVPSGRFGLIQIHAYTENDTLCVSVTDNGIGITQENIKKLLSDTSRVEKSTMSGIGIPNIDRRLKLVYGDDYGISIESELDHYTKVTITLPFEC